MNETAKQLGLLTTGSALGAAAMYLLDPRQSRRRQAIIRDKVAHYGRVLLHLSQQTARDFSHRGQGIYAETKSRLFPRHASRDVILARVRAHLGHLVTHPHAIEAFIDEKGLTLKGSIFHDEVDRLLQGVSKIPGVSSLINQLDLHPRENQGKSRRFSGAQLVVGLAGISTGLAGILLSKRGEIEQIKAS